MTTAISILAALAFHGTVCPVTTGHTMMARKGSQQVSRRDVLDGNATYKRFVKAGGGEALLAVIAASVALYGGRVRNGLFNDLEQLEASVSSSVPSPTVFMSTSAAMGQVIVELSATVPESLQDRIDYIWCKDAGTGETIAARSFKGSESPVLTTIAKRGRRLVPFVHFARDGTSQGEAFTVQE